MFIISL